MDDLTITTSKRNEKETSQQTLPTKFKRGLKLGCLNVCGLVSNPDKREALNHWIELNDLDIICIQEWFVPHGRQTELERKCNQVRIDDIKTNINDSDSDGNSDNDSVSMSKIFKN